MPRPSLPESEKRQQVGVRINPQDRDRLAASAAKSDTGIGLELERLALAQLDYLEQTDEPTRRLIGDIIAEIAEIRSAIHDKRWHKDRSSWAAVAEMLGTGPIYAYETDSPDDDPDIQALQTELASIRREKEATAQRLVSLGIEADATHPEWQKPKARIGGMFGRSGLGLNLLGLPGQREKERKSIEELPDGTNKDNAKALHTVLSMLDETEKGAWENYIELKSQYSEAEQEGRALYRSRQAQKAAHQWKNGQPFRFRDLIGYY